MEHIEPISDADLAALERLAKELVDPQDGPSSYHALVLRAIARIRSSQPRS